jgi:hypothetical protein
MKPTRPISIKSDFDGSELHLLAGKSLEIDIALSTILESINGPMLKTKIAPISKVFLADMAFNSRSRFAYELRRAIGARIRV